MSMFETGHPLVRDLDTVQRGMLVNFDQIRDELPEEIAIEYEDAMSSGDGVSTLTMANWVKKNRVTLFYPLAVDGDDPSWFVAGENDPEPSPVRHRVYVEDLLNRGFNFKLLKVAEDNRTPYLQFDVIDEGVVLSANIDGRVVRYFGEYESEGYNSLSLVTRNLVGIDLLKDLAA